MQQVYSLNRMNAVTRPFCEKMEKLYQEADMALTRAGAGTLFELALFGLPAVVLPYPHVEGHQEINARCFEKEGAISLTFEKGCTPEILKEKVLELVNLPTLRNRLRENLIRISKPEAAEKLAVGIEDLLQSKPQNMVGELEHATRP